ncbi:hypothetical protein BT96DRAFT_992339 [Gymnopus androsaceus JB14]|uniref:Uncharacterized protein n=1 Tax=Gymnopus androsaceus JB14 TaxID=1447944 RepID=A0A6A4HSM8_9AGAR|nr:hypothetical protein BT96DRAFT_992339 [Gymnopus androsaceus JB14]
MILGVCWEHGHCCNLEFSTLVDAKTVLRCLHSDVVHLASEGTVMAVTLLSGQPKEYAACPFCISGTCKHKNAEAHMEILSTTIEAVRDSQVGFFHRLYYIASNGAANQWHGASSLTLTSKLSPESKLYQ